MHKDCGTTIGRTKTPGSTRSRRMFGALVIALSTISAACSHKSPVAADDGGGTPEIFFNWLPAFLADQSAAQPSHEIMQWLDDPANFPRQDRLADLETILDRLGNAPGEYRQSASGYVPGDDPILGGIEMSIDQARAYLDDHLQFTPQILPLNQDDG